MNSIDVIKYLESYYPKTLAYEWDNVGLQVGTLNKKIKKCLITLDVTKEVVKEAIDKKVQLIISHHPLLFKPLLSVQIDTPRGWIIHHLIKQDISVYSIHTNYDLATGGMNDEFAKILKIQSPKLLDEEENIGRYGEIEETSMTEFIQFVKKKLEIDQVRLIGSLDKTIKVVGISGGSGSAHLFQAKRKNCDVYLTGDVTYHTALDALQIGQCVLDIGHYAEKIFKKAIASKLRVEFPEIDFMISEMNTDPYLTI
ncbi:MAG: Nif3-like dinuclear metal center hexameric protein [Firmicutes bacterium]|nr:Nif3-like dinuclear metal center hexameric protein [Bacillota bacterium]